MVIASANSNIIPYRSNWVRVSELRTTCAVCHKPDWCMVSEDGKSAICARIKSEKRAGNKGAGWVHKLDSYQPLRIPQPKSIKQNPKAAIQVLDTAYRNLLSILTLSPSHKANLVSRGIPESELSHYGTMPERDRADILRHLQSHNIQLSGVPGFFTDVGGSWHLGGAAGICIPVMDLQGRIAGIQIRRGNGYRIALRLGRDPKTGKYDQIWETVPGTKKDAEKRLAELIHQKDQGTLNKPGKNTVAEYLTNWLKDFIMPNLSPRTSEGYEVIIRKHAIPALGDIALTQLKPEHIQQFYADKLSKGLSARTVRHFHMCLHGAFKNAVRTGSLVRNPCDATNPPKDQKTEMRTMSESDIHIFLEYARNTEYYPIFYLALFTGMRRSEILGLRWSDVELLAPIQISVSRSLHQLKGKKIVVRTTKTDKSRRLIPISPSTAIVLRQYREAQDKIREALRIPALSDSDFVFCHVDGKPYLPNTVSHAWIKLVRKCGLRGIRLHDARHTMASIMLKNGVHPKIVQERLGHSSISITLDTYSHVIPSLQEAAANAFDDFVLPKEEARE